MTRFFLIEDDSPGLDLQKGEAIAVSPWAAYSLKKRNHPYRIMEDFYSETELREAEESFFEKQLEWFAGFDAFLSDRIPAVKESGWKLASIHLNRFKYLIDSFLIRNYAVQKFLDQTRPSEIVCVEKTIENEPLPSIYEFKRRDRWSYLPLLKRAAETRGIRVRVETVSAPPAKKASRATLDLPPVLKKNLKSLKNFFYYRKYQKSGQRNGHNLLFLDAGVFSIDVLIRDAIRKGCGVFLKQGKTVTGLHPTVEKRWELRGLSSPLSASALESLEAIFFASELYQSLLAHFSWDAGHLLRPYFSHFFNTIVPDALAESVQMAEFLQSQKIDAIVARASAGSNYPSALMAGGSLEIPRICFQHSVGPANMKDWVFDELAFFDFNFAISAPASKYFQAEAQTRYPRCSVFESSESLNFLKQTHAVPPGKSKQPIPRLLYVPVKLAGGMSHFNTMFYPMTWYFEYQTKILSYLAGRRDYAVIYKHAFKQEWADQSVIPWLMELKAPNIRIVQGLFTEFVQDADRVFFDYPSTGLFESAACGLPVLALHHHAMKIAPGMRAVFGPSLQAFVTPEEAIEKLKNYLDRPADEFRASLKLRQGSGYEHLTSLLDSPEFSRGFTSVQA